MGKVDISRLTRQASKVGRKIKKNLPEIAVFSGLGFMTAGTVDAVRATTHLSDVLDECKADIGSSREAKSLVEDGSISKHEYAKGLTKAYARSVGRIGKLYARSAVAYVTGGLSVISGTVSRRKQYKELAGSLATVTGAYAALRQTMYDKLGSDQANELINGVEEKVVLTTTPTNELKEEKVKLIPGPSTCPPCTPYAIIINDTGRRCIKERVIEGVSKEYIPDIDAMISVAEDFKILMNREIVKKGVIEYNADIREFFNLPYVKEGFNMGKVYDPNKDVNNQLEVYIYKGTREALDYRGRTYLEPIVKIDFNLDGGISESFEEITN